MFVGKPPYFDETSMSAILKIIKNEPPKAPSEIQSSSLRSFISSCLTKEPHLRPTARDLMATFKSMLSTAKKNSYIKEKLGPFYIVHSDQQEQSNNTGGVKKSKSSNIVWDFDIGEDEEGEISQVKQSNYPRSKHTKSNPTDI